MLLSDETYEKLIMFTKERSSRNALDFTFSDLRRSFPDIDPAEILAKLHLLKDEWIINEVSPNCYTINKILLDPIQLKSSTRKSSKKSSHAKSSSSRSSTSSAAKGKSNRKYVLTK